MISDASTVPDGATEEADVCVVGAGPAGITLGLELRDLPARVLVLESGTSPPGSQVLARAENADPHYYRLSSTRMRGFAGTSNHWLQSSGMRARPLDPLDFEKRPEIDRDGWPFPREELDPYYARAQEICGLGPYDYRPDAHDHPGERKGGGRPEVEVDADVVEALFQIADLGRFAGRRDELAAATNVEVMLGATVLEVVTGEAGRRVEELVVGHGTRRFTVRARLVVIAAGGVENPRLLLLSRRTHEEGIGNANDLVGRCFMEHPHIRTGVLRPSGPVGEATARLSSIRRADGFGVYTMLRPSDAWLRSNGALATAWNLFPTSEALITSAARSLVDLRDTFEYFRRPLPGTTRRVARLVRRPRETVAALVHARRRDLGDEPIFWLHAMSEQEPNRESRVTLGRRRDPFGLPVARVDWRLTERDLRSVRSAQDLLDAELRRRGIGHVEGRLGDDATEVVGAGFHHMGTTRMHADPRQGVVDPDARVHGVGNLYVAGSSVFPTGGYANPTLTVVALAVRLADHLRREMRAVPRVGT